MSARTRRNSPAAADPAEARARAGDPSGEVGDHSGDDRIVADISDEIFAAVQALGDMRLEMLKSKNFTEADKIRDDLAAKGIQLKDGKDKETGERVTTWEVKR